MDRIKPGQEFDGERLDRGGYRLVRRAAPVSFSGCGPTSRISQSTPLKWTELLARLRRTGNSMPVKDRLIAATAAVHELAVVTRHHADFLNAGVRILDPLAG